MDQKKSSVNIKTSNGITLKEIVNKKCNFCRNSHKDLLRVITIGIYNKYESKTQRIYNLNIINDIIYNSSTHIVAMFKDYLIFDDRIEFLKRHYNFQESQERTHKLCDFYHKYSKVFPSYFLLEEKKYMFKNIERKQKMIDEKHKALMHADAEKAEIDKKLNNRILTKNFIGALSSTRSRLKNSCSKLQITQLRKLTMPELIEKYIDHDSMSVLATTACGNVEATFFKEKRRKACRSGKCICKS